MIFFVGHLLDIVCLDVRMIAICVEKDKKNLNLLIDACVDMPEIDEVRGYRRTRKALKYLETNTADIAIMDLDMPDMNGTTLASRLRKEHPDMSMIFISGNEKYAVEAFAMHVSGFLLKPIDKDKLDSEMEHVIEKKERPHLD